jgi:predicted ester cyclase
MCEQWQDMLLAYVNGTLTPDEMAALEAHLAVCEDCQAALDDWRMLARAAKAEVEALKGRLPPLVLPGNSHYVDHRPASSPTRKPDKREDRKMFMNTALRLPGASRRLSVPLTLMVALALTLIFSALLIFNRVPNLSLVLTLQQPETPTTVFERYINEVWNAGNLDALDDMVAPEFKQYDLGLSAPIADIAALKTYIEQFRSNLPGVTFTFDEITAEGDMVFACLTAAGDGFSLPLTVSARLDNLQLSEVWFDANALLETQNASMEQQNALAARRLAEEVFINGNKTVTDELIKEGATWCAGAHPTYCAPMSNGFRRNWEDSLQAAFPDLELQIERVLADGDTVWLEMRGRGTFTQELLDPISSEMLSPTNKVEQWSWLMVFTFEDGTITKERWYWFWYGWPATPPA